MRMRMASKNLVEEKVPVFTDRVNKAKNTYVDYNPAKSNLDRYILEVSDTLNSPKVRIFQDWCDTAERKRT